MSSGRAPFRAARMNLRHIACCCPKRKEAGGMCLRLALPDFALAFSQTLIPSCFEGGAWIVTSVQSISPRTPSCRCSRRGANGPGPRSTSAGDLTWPRREPQACRLLPGGSRPRQLFEIVTKIRHARVVRARERTAAPDIRAPAPLFADRAVCYDPGSRPSRRGVDRNGRPVILECAALCRPSRRGGVDRNDDARRSGAEAQVASYAGAWIETTWRISCRCLCPSQ